MNPPPSRQPRATAGKWPPLLVAVAASLSLVLFTGCDKDDIRSYTVQRGETDLGTGPVRLLAAMVPAGEEAWFIKMVGRADVVEMVEPAFGKLLDSLSHDEKAEPHLRWKVPANWVENRVEDPKNPTRVATLRPEGAPGPDISISKLPRNAAVLKPNVDRWRRVDLGLGPISGRNLGKVTRTRKVAGLEVSVVDLRGPGVTRDKPKSPPPGPAKKDAPAPLTYKVPAGWRDSGKLAAFLVASLSVSDGAKTARVTVTPLAGSMPGGLLANVNRWRTEIKLPELTDLKQADIRPFKIAGLDARVIDLPGAGERSLIAWLEHRGQTWFFKMRGDADLVARQKSNFQSFLESVTFTGAADE